MIAIVDYGAGNLQSVEKAFQYLGSPAQITKDPGLLREASAIVLPGVGAFGDAMASMKQSGLIKSVLDCIERGVPFLGICLGYQLLFEESEENPGISGLGVLPGRICRFPQNQGVKVPQIGWNSLLVDKWDGVFQGVEQEPYVYFVHSYYVKAGRREDVSARALYGVEFDAAVQRAKLHAVQFHPEKSGKTGLKLLKNFIQCAKEEA